MIWFLSIPIIPLVISLIYIVGGLRGYEVVLFAIGVIGVFGSVGTFFGLEDHFQKKGCLIIIACFIVAVMALIGAFALDDYIK
jgi:hypothetical protein